MTATFNQDSINIRSELSKRVPPPTKQKWYVGDGANKSFTYSRDLYPYQVFNAGKIQKPGAGEDYIIKIGEVHFNVSPANGNDIVIFLENQI